MPAERLHMLGVLSCSTEWYRKTVTVEITHGKILHFHGGHLLCDNLEPFMPFSRLLKLFYVFSMPGDTGQATNAVDGNIDR
jgi:hypothetical protein